MRRVRCYGRAKTARVDSSLIRDFFGDEVSETCIRNKSPQGLRHRTWNTSSSADETNNKADLHSIELFDSNLSIDLFSSSGPKKETSVPAKCSTTKNSCTSKIHIVSDSRQHSKNVYSFTATGTDFSDSHSTVDLHFRLNKKKQRKKKLKGVNQLNIKSSKVHPLKKLRTNRGSISVSKTETSYSNSKITGKKRKSKSAKFARSYKTRRCKKICKTDCHKKDYSPIPIQPRWSSICQNPLSTKKSHVVKKKRSVCKYSKLPYDKKNWSRNKNNFIDSNLSYEGTGTGSSLECNLLQIDVEPNWSSILEHSLAVEKLPDNNKRCAQVLYPSSETDSRQIHVPPSDFCIAEHSVVTKAKTLLKDSDNQFQGKEKQNNPEPINFVLSDLCSSMHENLKIDKATAENRVYSRDDEIISLEDVNFFETAGVNYKEGQAVSANTNAKKDSAIITGADFIPHKMVFESKNFCENFSRIHSWNELVYTDKENVNSEKFSSSNIVCKILETNKSGGNDLSCIPCTDYIPHKIVSHGKSISENNKAERIYSESERLKQQHISVRAMKSKGFDFSTPLSSPVSQSTGLFTPAIQKGIFTTSTPSASLITNDKQLINVSRIPSFGCKWNFAQNLSADSVKSKKCRESGKKSSILPRNYRSCSSVLHNVIDSKSSTHHHLSRSCISHSKLEESVLKDVYCSARRHSSMKELHSLSNSFYEAGYESTLEKLLEFCRQTSLIPFKEIYDWRYTTVRKIGEGTFGEVFTLVQKKLSSVVKIIPFSENNDCPNMQSVESVLSEVTVAQCLSELRNNKIYKTKNFNKLKSVHLVKGLYPDQMLTAWDEFSVAKTSYNSRPDAFDDQQLFAIIELEYGGKDMSCFVLRNAVEAESVLKQITISLAIAEESHMFEHRDLHLGNILVQRNKSKTISYVLRGQPFSIPNHGVVVTIIDFTLSRVLDRGCIFYNDLAEDESLFNQSGDYQFEIYRATKLHLNNVWHKCLLYSNVLWLTFLCVKVLECEYSRPSSKKHQESLKNIKVFQNNLKTCESAFQCLTNCNILTSIPEQDQDSKNKLSVKARLIDRNSFKKSMSRHMTSIA